ncbi:hypothetical protein V8G54_026038 [Vigna mungo]|uniref:Uncharacterized protein n=1 Tax=Vigna mungo TaxID=3915 RepID=A0AAQ3MZE9_VIGMU
MEILPVNDLDIALQNFVNKDEKMAFYTCVQYNIQETRVKLLILGARFRCKKRTAATVRPPPLPSSPVGVVDSVERCAQHRRSQSRKSLLKRSCHAPPPSQTGSPKPPESVPRVADLTFTFCSSLSGETYSPSPPQKGRRSLLIMFLGLAMTRLAFI